MATLASKCLGVKLGNRCKVLVISLTWHHRTPITRPKSSCCPEPPYAPGGNSGSSPISLTPAPAPTSYQPKFPVVQV